MCDFTQCCVEAPSAAVPASGLFGSDATFSVARGGALSLRPGGSSFDSWLDFYSIVRQVCTKHCKPRDIKAKGQGSAVKELFKKKR